MPPPFIAAEAGAAPEPFMSPGTRAAHEAGVERDAKRAALRSKVASRGKKGSFKKFRQKMNIAYKKGGAGGAALQLGSAALDAATFNKLAGAGRVSMLRGLGGLGALGMLGYMAAKPTYDILTEETDLFGPGGQTQRAAQLAADLQDINYQAAGRSANAARMLENERLKQSIRQNLADIAQNSPALYNQVSAGRRLPRGAVVLGGQQRQDLLMELAHAMDRGAFQKQDPLSDLMG